MDNLPSIAARASRVETLEELSLVDGKFIDGTGAVVNGFALLGDSDTIDEYVARKEFRGRTAVVNEALLGLKIPYSRTVGRANAFLVRNYHENHLEEAETVHYSFSFLYIHKKASAQEVQKSTPPVQQ